MTRGLTAAAVLLAVLLGTSAASAASAESRAAAKQHVKQAEELKKQGQLAESCKHWEEVERLDPKLPTLMELAECSEQLGKVVEAQAWWALARDRAKHDEKPQSRARAEGRLAAVQKRVAHLTLQLAAGAAGAQVLWDGAPLEPASLTAPLPVNPGEHVVLVKLAGHDDGKYPVKLADGAAQTLAIAAGPATGTGTPPPTPAAPAPAPSLALPATAAPTSSKVVAEPAQQEGPKSQAGFWSGQRKVGAVLGLVGLAAVGGGSVLVVAANRDAKGQDIAMDQRLSLGAISVVSGAVLLLSGVVLFAGSSSSEAAQQAGLTVAPTLLVARHAAVLGAAGEF